MSRKIDARALMTFLVILRDLSVDWDTGLIKPEEQDRAVRWMDTVLPPDIAEMPDEDPPKEPEKAK